MRNGQVHVENCSPQELEAACRLFDRIYQLKQEIRRRRKEREEKP